MNRTDLRVLSEVDSEPEDRVHTGHTGQVHVEPGDTVLAFAKQHRGENLELRNIVGVT